METAVTGQRAVGSYSAKTSPNASATPLQPASFAACRSMLRLANGDDTEFALRTGNRVMPCNPRKVQRALVRQCLRKLSADFCRLHAEAQSGPAQKIKFKLHILRIRIQLALHTVAPHRIDLAPLLADLESLADAAPGMTRALLRCQ